MKTVNLKKWGGDDVEVCVKNFVGVLILKGTQKNKITDKDDEVFALKILYSGYAFNLVTTYSIYEIAESVRKEILTAFDK